MVDPQRWHHACPGPGFYERADDETEFWLLLSRPSRALSRTQAFKKAKGRAIHRELEDNGVFAQSRGKRTLKEEMPEAYKDIPQVVSVVHNASLARKVARLKPLGVIKG